MQSLAIRTKLLISFCLLAVVPVALLGVLVSQRTEEILQQRVTREMQVEVVATAETLDTYLEGVRRDLLALTRFLQRRLSADMSEERWLEVLPGPAGRKQLLPGPLHRQRRLGKTAEQQRRRAAGTGSPPGVSAQRGSLLRRRNPAPGAGGDLSFPPGFQFRAWPHPGDRGHQHLRPGPAVIAGAGATGAWVPAAADGGEGRIRGRPPEPGGHRSFDRNDPGTFPGIRAFAGRAARQPGAAGHQSGPGVSGHHSGADRRLDLDADEILSPPPACSTRTCSGFKQPS